MSLNIASNFFNYHNKTSILFISIMLLIPLVAMAALDYRGTYELTKILPNGPADEASAIPLPSSYWLQVVSQDGNNNEEPGTTPAKYGLSIKVANSMSTIMSVAMPIVAEANDEPQAVTVDAVRSTRMLGAPEQRKVEDALNRMFPNTNRIQYNGDTKELIFLQSDNDGQILFIKNDSEAE